MKCFICQVGNLFEVVENDDRIENSRGEMVPLIMIYSRCDFCNSNTADPEQVSKNKIAMKKALL